MLADSADAVLFVQHLLIAGSVNASSAPFTLLGIMSMAEIFGVQVIIAAVDHADARRLFAVSVFGVAMTQQTLVVGLAQALSFYRLSTTFLNALRWLCTLA